MDLDFLIPVTKSPNDHFRFGVITSTSPLRLRLDGDASPIAITPITVASVGTGDRVLVQIHLRQLIIIGRVGGPPSTAPVFTEIPNAVNLDTYITTGRFMQSQNAEAAAGSNYPAPLAGYLEVIAPNTTFVYQYYLTYGATSGNRLYWRSKYSTNAWRPWEQAFTMEDVKTVLGTYSVKAFGAVGSGLVNDYVAVQAAFTACKNAGGGRVLFPAGIYRVDSEVNVYGNTTIDLNWSILRRNHAGYTFIVGDRGATYNGWDGMQNISVVNGTIDHNGNNQSGLGSTWTMSHCRNVSFDQVTFKNATSHAIELNASYNVRVTSCTFAGYRNPNANEYVEAIQLDIAMTGGFSAYGAFDGAFPEHILIDSCTFISSENYPAHPRGIGSHGGRVDAAPRDITIRSNRFVNLPSWAIRPYNWHQVTVKDNYCTGGMFFLANTTIVGDGTSDNTKTVSGVQTGASVDVAGYSFSGNQHRGPGSSLYFNGEATGRFLGIHIGDNRFDNSYAGDHCIQFNYCDSITISGGSIYRAGVSGIATPPGGLVSNMTITGLVIDGANANGIGIQGFSQVAIAGVIIKNIGNLAANTYNHIRLTGTGNQITITGVQASSAGSVGPAAYGFYANGSITRLTRVGCDWGGRGVSDASVSPVVAAERT